MRNFSDRIKRLEKGITDQSITATTEDGAVMRFRRDDVLALTCASFRRRHAAIEGEPMPVTKFDTRLDLLARVGVRSTTEPLIEIAADMVRKSQEDGR